MKSYKDARDKRPTGGFVPLPHIEKYPEIKSKQAYAMFTDEKIAEFVAKGEPLDVAIRKAGDAVAKEWGLGKGGIRSTSRRSAAHPSQTDDDDGSADYPATIASMLDARAGRRGTD